MWELEQPENKGVWAESFLGEQQPGVPVPSSRDLVQSVHGGMMPGQEAGPGCRPGSGAPAKKIGRGQGWPAWEGVVGVGEQQS